MKSIKGMAFRTKSKSLQNLLTKMVNQKVNETYKMFWMGETDWKWKQKYMSQFKTTTKIWVGR